MTLSDDERDQLARWSLRRKSSQALALQAWIVLACTEDLDNKAVAGRLGCTAATVGKWRGRFIEDRLDGLGDEPRPEFRDHDKAGSRHETRVIERR